MGGNDSLLEVMPLGSPDISCYSFFLSQAEFVSFERKIPKDVHQGADQTTEVGKHRIASEKDAGLCIKEQSASWLLYLPAWMAIPRRLHSLSCWLASKGVWGKQWECLKVIHGVR